MTDDFPKASLANWRQHPHSIWGFTHVDELLPVAPIPGAARASVLPMGALLDLRDVPVPWAGEVLTAEAVLGLTHTDSLMVLRDGARVVERYVNQSPQSRHIVFSVSKSISAMLAGVLVEQGRLDPEAPVIRYVPEARNSAYGDCTVRHVLDMTVSIKFTEDYLDPAGDVARYRVAMGWNPPGAMADVTGLQSFVAGLPKGAHDHGYRFHYVSPNTDMLGWILERAGGESFAALLSSSIWKPAEMASDAIITLDRFGAPRTAGGLCTTLSDLARFGELVRCDGRRGDRQVVPRAWIEDIRHHGDVLAWSRGEMAMLFPEGRYRSKWYVPEPSGEVICAIGIHGQWIYIDTRANVVIVKQSSQPVPSDDHLDRLTLAMFRAIAGVLGR
jgi:CubicO group peptidase (beta-lactamase class C family)